MNKSIIFFFAFLTISLISSAQEQARPIIGISASTGGDTLASVRRTYVESVILAGGIPFLLPITDDQELISEYLSVVDAVVMTGGENIDPLKWYGEEPIDEMGKISPKRDQFDFTLIKRAVDMGMPVLGVCRGHQIMNVAFGGTLYQDIPVQIGTNVKHRQLAPRNYGTHSINIKEGSILHKLMDSDSIVVNSFHHLAVKDIAPGFRATAFTKDGVVEAIEKKDSRRVFGIQFHAEDFATSGNSKFLKIFELVVNEANAYRKEKMEVKQKYFFNR